MPARDKMDASGDLMRPDCRCVFVIHPLRWGGGRGGGSGGDGVVYQRLAANVLLLL